MLKRRIAAGLFIAGALACSTQTSERVGQSRSAGSTPSSAQTLQFAIELPLGTQPPDVLAAAQGSLTFEQGVRLDDSSGHTTVGNAGSGLTSAGIGTIVGDATRANSDPQLCPGVPRPPAQPTIVDVVSAAPILLQRNAEVTGGVVTTSQPVKQQGAAIAGALAIEAGPLFSSSTWSVTFPSVQSADLKVEPDHSSWLTPGSYGTVSVAQGATLALTSGTYTFASLYVDTGATIHGDTALGPLVIYVETSLHVFGSIVPSGGASELFLGFAGDSSVILEKAFSGTFLAPNATLTLASLANAGPGQQAQGHQGAFFAASLDVHECVNVTHVPFAGWASVIQGFSGASDSGTGSEAGTADGGQDASMAKSPDGSLIDGEPTDATIDSAADGSFTDAAEAGTDSPSEGDAALLCAPYPVGVAQCGQLGGACCPDSSCTGSAVCVGSVCQPCGGGATQMCCPGDTCGPGVLCSGGTCSGPGTPIESPCPSCGSGCGTVGQFCCESDPGSFRCTQASSFCTSNSSSGTCIACGGTGEPCCFGTCHAGLVCDVPDGGQGGLPEGTCDPCGASGTACCPGRLCAADAVCIGPGSGTCSCGQQADDAGAAGFVEYALPAGASVLDVTVGPDGAVWFTESSGKIGQLSPVTGALTELDPSPGTGPILITSGPDGNLWFSVDRSFDIERMTPTGQTTLFTLSLGIEALTSGPLGSLWFGSQGALGDNTGLVYRLTTDGGVTALPTLPKHGIEATAVPTGLIVGPDQNLWYFEAFVPYLSRLTPSGVVTAFLTSGQPYDMCAGPDGNIWFTERQAQMIGRITPNGVLSEFATPSPSSNSGITTGSGPVAITAGPDGSPMVHVRIRRSSRPHNDRWPIDHLRPRAESQRAPSTDRVVRRAPLVQ